MKKSMRKALLTGMLALALAAAVMAGLLASLEISVVRKNLRAILDTASAWTADSTGDLGGLASRIARSAPPLRVTFLLPEGIVLADSHRGAPGMADLSAEPDVRDAAAKGAGEFFSLSGEGAVPTLYASRLLSGRLVIRLSYPLSEILGTLWLYIPVLALLFAALAFIQRRSVLIVAGGVITQLERVRGLLEGSLRREGMPADAFYPEIRPAMEEICRLIDRMRYDLEEIRRTRDMRRDFIANASHALKNPLASILGFAELLAESPDLPRGKREQYLGYVIAESKRMMSVINSILLLEKPAAGQQEAMAEIDMAALADDVAVSLEPQCRKRHITITITGHMEINAAERDMRELLHNLIGNAVRYGKDGGWVRVALGPGAMTVSDNGIGMEKDQIPRIFEPFYRVENTSGADRGGTGLGLAIVSRIVEKYGGGIRVESTPGEGSSFTVSFVRNV